MRQILIATHSNLADGFLASMKYFLTDISNITVINAFTKDNNIEKTISDYFETHKNDEIIAFTDIYFGSINQILSRYFGKEDYHLITGTNLPVLLEILTKPSDQKLSSEEIDQMITKCKESIIYMNTYKTESGDDDE